MNEPRVEIYEAKDGWRWRAIAGNGKIIGDSAEAYTTRAKAEHGLRILTGALAFVASNPDRLIEVEG